jgi:PKD repeat protein
VTAPADQTASEGTGSSFSLGSFLDPGDDDPWEVTVDWGDGTADTVFTEPNDGPIAAKPHTYADNGNFTVTVTVKEDNGAGAGGSATFQVAVANVPPDVTAPADQTATEGTSKTFDLGSFTDPGADSPWRVTVDWGDLTADTVFTETSPGAIADQSHPYVDSGTYTVTITVEEENGAGPGSDTATFQVTVANVAPTVAKPTFEPTLVGCRGSTTLKNISFSDPGVQDYPWTVDIDWGDGSPHTVYVTATQGAQPNQSHTYLTAGTFTATVSVTDKDGGTGSNTSTAAVTVFQYTVEFLPPVDGSSAAGVVVNKMKNGRVVPVKVKVRDLCAGADLTDPSAKVTIKVTKSSGTSGAGDPVEEYADAGNSSAGTDEFRWSTPHWIYNLDSKALGLVVGNKYRVDVYVNNVRATIATWAILEPVK